MGAEYNKKTPGWVEKRLRKYGRNPYGENIYRVIWSETRHTICDGKLTLEYGEFQPQWMLEKWKSAEEYAGMGPIEWDMRTRDPITNEYIIGPYPSEGFFCHCYSFGNADLVDATVNLICWAIEKGLGLSPAERKQGLEDERKRKEDAAKQKRDAEYDDAQDSASKGAAVDRVTQPVSGTINKFKRRDDVVVNISADELEKTRKIHKRGFSQIPN